jgi:F-type H+-transporting ATPase subunit delta
MAVAQRMYARALFEAARDEGRLTQVPADLAAIAGAIDDVPELGSFLRNPQVDPAGKAELLDEIAKGADELVRNFVRLVAEKGRAGELPEMSAELEGLVAQAENRLAVELQTAHELSDDEAAAIVKTIEEASGREVEATRSVDPSLIGGIVLRVGSFRADGSVRGRLERLRHELVTAAQ